MRILIVESSYLAFARTITRRARVRELREVEWNEVVSELQD